MTLTITPQGYAELARAWRDADADRQLAALDDRCPWCQSPRHTAVVCPTCRAPREQVAA